MTLRNVLVHSERLVKRRGAGGGKGMGTFGHRNISIGVNHQVKANMARLWTDGN